MNLFFGGRDALDASVRSLLLDKIKTFEFVLRALRPRLLPFHSFTCHVSFSSFIYFIPTMRFRAKAGCEQFQFVADAFQQFQKLSETCTIKFTPEYIFVAANENAGGQDGVPAFAKFDQSVLFFDYRIEARAANTICLEMKPAHLLRATRALKDTPEITLSLTKKKGNPKLTLSAKDTRGVDYIQDVSTTGVFLPSCLLSFSLCFFLLGAQLTLLMSCQPGPRGSISSRRARSNGRTHVVNS